MADEAPLHYKKTGDGRRIGIDPSTIVAVEEVLFSRAGKKPAIETVIFINSYDQTTSVAVTADWDTVFSEWAESKRSKDKDKDKDEEPEELEPLRDQN